MPYRLLLDEHVEPQFQRYLDHDGHDVIHVASIIDVIEHQFTAKELDQRMVVKVVDDWL